MKIFMLGVLWLPSLNEMILDRVHLARSEMLLAAATSLLVAAWSPLAVPLLRPRLAVRHAVMMSEARTMPSGLVYEEITAGTGDSPALEQLVKVRHRGGCVHTCTHDACSEGHVH